MNTHLSLGLTDDLSTLADSYIFETIRQYPNLSEFTLLQTVADILGQQYCRIDDLVIDPRQGDTFDSKVCRQERFIPIYCDNLGIGIAIDNPFNDYVHSKEFTTNFPNQTHVYIPKLDMDQYWQMKHSIDIPLSKLEQILKVGIQEQASDIHFSDTGTTLTVQFRVHGKMVEIKDLLITNRDKYRNLLKFQAGMDLGQHTLPQDGHIQFKCNDRYYDIRVSTLPTVHGEDFVCRLFEDNMERFNLETLGLPEPVLVHYLHLLTQSSGLILVTGPTGSGKTSTLYASIKEILKTKNRQIITLENPVEAVLTGVRQSQINDAIGYNFQDGLKAILRQDPDVIVIGEIRDSDSAKAALDAAYTGHLVLASLHTNNVENTIKRLESFHLDPFLIQQSLRAICSQKLVIEYCIECHKLGCRKCRYTGIKKRNLKVEYLGINDKASLSSWNNGFKKLCEEHVYLG